VHGRSRLGRGRGGEQPLVELEALGHPLDIKCVIYFRDLPRSFSGVPAGAGG
jgi:hypothetical protein